MKILSIVGVFCIALITTSCAGKSGEYAAAAGIGGAAGCLIAKATNGKCAKGAAYGVAVGLAAQLIRDMIIEQRSRRVATSDQVAELYKEEHAGQLPTSPTITAYATSTDPDAVVEPGIQYTIASAIEVTPGNQNDVVVLEEELLLYDNEDTSELLKSTKKTVNDDQSGGRFNNAFTFTLPEGLPEGIYPMETKVYLNGEAVQTTALEMQVVVAANNARDVTFKIAAR